MDVISLADGAAEIGVTAKTLVRISKTSKKPLLQVLKKMTKAERKKLGKELANFATKEQTKIKFNKLAKAGKLPSIYSNNKIQRGIINQLISTISSEIGVYSAMKGDTGRKLNLYFANDSGGK